MTPVRIGFACAAAVLAGCTSTNPPLIFGDHVNMGVHVGNDTASGNAAVSVGYKHRSIAIVPVSMLDDDGNAYAMKAHDRGTRDALSVFAVFESSARPSDAPATDQTVRLGQVFSTGLAAQRLTAGFDCRARGDTACSGMPSTHPSTAAPAPPLSSSPSASNSTTAPPPAATERPFQRPLVFVRTDVYGFDIGGSVAEQGGQFALGYSSRNLALIPVISIDGRGKVSRLTSDDGQSSDLKDSFSVLGQFRSDAQTSRLGFGLERYFATGMAAQNLSSGLRAAIANGGAQTTAQPAQPGVVRTAVSE